MTATLDANIQAQIWQGMLEQVWRRNLGLLVISHDAALVARLCSHAIYLVL
ncbi:MAG: hypothetical protein KDE58_04500 [Caldilineaceae bacterium]|nr:hypothetical protein [Caldilineaceae bacterium]